MRDIFSKIPIPEKNRESFLGEFLSFYIETPGLGAMPKSDLNALLVFLLDKYGDKRYSNFDLSRMLKISESKVRNLRILALSRFDLRTERDFSNELLELLTKAKYEIHNINTYEIRFLLVDILLSKYLEKIVEENEGTISYTRNSHQVVLSISNLLSVYETLLKQKYEGKELGNLLSLINDNLKNELVKAANADRIPLSEKKKPALEILRETTNSTSSVLNIIDKASLINGVLKLFQ